MMIVLPDGTSFMATPSWAHTSYAGVLRVGAWVPVLMPPGNPDKVKLDHEHVPTPLEVAAAIGEALGGPPAKQVPVDEWRVNLALDYAQRIIADGVFKTEQAEAIRKRIKEGI
jgi:hypothetical protein